MPLLRPGIVKQHKNLNSNNSIILFPFRHEANTRKLEASHRDQTMQMYRQAMHVARAINHFRDKLSGVLQREGIEGAGTDIANLLPLPSDEVKLQSPLSVDDVIYREYSCTFGVISL